MAWMQSIEAMQFRELLEDLSEERLHMPYKELLQKSVDRCASSVRGAGPCANLRPYKASCMVDCI